MAGYTPPVLSGQWQMSECCLCSQLTGDAQWDARQGVRLRASLSGKGHSASSAGAGCC